MNKDELKKALNQYTKDELIEALGSSFIPESSYSYLISRLRDIRFNKLDLEQGKVLEEMEKLRLKLRPDMSTKEKIDYLKKEGELNKKYDRLSKQIDKVLDSFKN